jgi:hypothetical protein
MQCMYEDCCSMLRSFACLIILLCIPIELMVKFPPWSKRNYNTSTYITVFGLPLVEQDSDSESDNTVHSDDDLQDAQSTHWRPPDPTTRLPHPILIEAGAKQRIQQVQQKPVQELPSSKRSHQRSPRSATIPRSTLLTLGTNMPLEG